MSQETRLLDGIVRPMVRSALLEHEMIVAAAVQWMEQQDVDADDGRSKEDWSLALVDKTVAGQIVQESGWGEAFTDVDRLLAAFQSLELEQILCFEDFDFSVREGHQNAIADIAGSDDPTVVRGYVFYTGQDLDAVLKGRPLLIAFGAWGFTGIAVVRQALVNALGQAGLEVAEGTVDERVSVKIQWHRRGWASGDLGPAALI
ncbi:MAG: hypothetical protein GWP91_12935 [Rhodobacterales bacterium]|nr:hypothetical protein [Rhodobacterales bacterium]